MGPAVHRFLAPVLDLTSGHNLIYRWKIATVAYAEAPIVLFEIKAGQACHDGWQLKRSRMCRKIL